MIVTYQDFVDNLVDVLGGGLSDQVTRQIRQAILEAYDEFPRAHNWPYLYRHGRIFTTTPFGGIEVETIAANGTITYSTPNPLYDPPSPGTSTQNGVTTIVTQATIQYQQSSGTYPYQVTLSGGTWPSWAAAGYLRIAGCDGSYNYVAYRVNQMISATVLTLDNQVNPGYDIPAGTNFILYQDTYELPPDFIAQDQALYELNIGGMEFVHPRDWLYENRYVLSEGTPVFYTVTGDPQYPGRLVMRVVPWPVESRSIDFIYKRSPRPLRIQQATGGTLTLSANSNTVTCTTGSFNPAMVGSVIRISGNSKPPSSAIGSVAGYNPPAIEACITAYISPTVVSISSPSPSAMTGVNWYVTDPIDCEQGAMLNAFRRCAEKCLAKIRKSKDAVQAASDYLFALEQAKAASSPSFAGRCAGPQLHFRRRLRDMGYVGPDQP